MKVPYNIQKAADQLGIKGNLKREQVSRIKSILRGNDQMLIYPVGFGKSAIFQIPAILNGNYPTIVFEPTVSLMYDQVQRLQACGISADYISHRNRSDHDRILEDYENGSVTLLYVTPERINDSAFREAIAENPPWLVVIDEAHCVIEWGVSFRPDYQRIGDFIDHLEQRPVVVAMTATAPKSYRRDMLDEFDMDATAVHTAPLGRSNLYVIRETMVSDKILSRCRRAKTLINKYAGDGRVVVYCSTKSDTDKAYNYLKEKFPKQVIKCHSFMDDEERADHEMKFIKGKRRIMVATTAFGMGVNISDIRLVLHLSMPISPVSYYQEIGRAGRDGEKSRCVLLYHPDDHKKFSRILKEEENEKAKKQIEKGIQQMKDIAEGDSCIMKAVLTILDDEDPKPCGRCSVCQSKRQDSRKGA